MGCSCAGSEGLCGCHIPIMSGAALVPVGPGNGLVGELARAGGGIVLEPFPRQTLVGISGGPVTYTSPIYDATQWKSIAWWFECFGSLPGVVGNPLSMYIDTAASMEGPWDELASQTAGPLLRYAGCVVDPASLVRVRVVIIAGEVSTLEVHLVCRGG